MADLGPSEERPAGKRRQAEFVYFVESEVTNLIKIGVARDMTARLRALQTGSPDKLKVVALIRDPDPKRLEHELHVRFRRSRSHGEWFAASADLVDYIVANAKSPAEDERDEREARMADWVRRGVVGVLPAGPTGNTRKAKMARYLLARGLSA
jgi:hypothetical protein